MANQNESKINHLLSGWPYSSVFTSSYLESMGYSHNLLTWYRKKGWLKPVGRGALARPGDEIDWTGGLYAIQTQLKLPIHAAAKTALELQGVVHFVRLGKGGIINLFGEPATKLPSWFKNYDWGVKPVYTATELFSDNASIGLTELKRGAYSIQVSSRERAILEVLHLVPHQQEYEEAKLLMEGLRTLRPKLVQALLESCKSIKVKRLFMHLAEALALPWVKKLDLSKVNFGEGKRVVVKGGVFNSKYKISVPETYSNEGSGNEG